MIFYFSGTGNSKWVAEKLSNALSETLHFIPDVATTDFSLTDNEKIGFVFPVYSWGIPPIVMQFVEKLHLASYKKQYLFFVCTCGDEVGLVPIQFEKAVSRKGWVCSSGFSVIMPNNYVLLPGFNVDSDEVVHTKIKEASTRISTIANQIERSFTGFDCTVGTFPFLKSRLIYPLFVKWGIFPSKFHVTTACNGCKRCERICPIQNIRIEQNKPKWGKECTSCLACFHICPQYAVQYGKSTAQKGHYFFSETL